MGVPGLFRYLVENFRHSIILSTPQPCEYLWFDYNCLLHKVKPQHGGAYDFDAMIEYTLAIHAMVAPTKGTVIAVDGIPPVAKMAQQRKRRHMAATPSDNDFDSVCITPGTPFMHDLSSHIDRLQTMIPNLVVSNWTEVGEGEHKLFLQSKAGSNVAVYGMDADMILLSLLHSHRLTITLVRESSNSSLTSTDVHPHDFTFVSIDSLSQALQQIVRIRTDVQSMLIDFVALTILAGNDFLPPLLHIHVSHMPKLVGLYNNIDDNRCLVSPDMNINTDFLAKILSKLKFTEDADTIAAHDNSYNKNPMFNPRQAGWRSRWYTIFVSQIGGTAQKSCSMYACGMNWVLEYYATNQIPALQWFYPYDYSPTVTDLHNHILVSSDTATTMVPVPLTHALHLACVMPVYKYHHVPQEYRALSTDVSLGCVHLFPHKFCVHSYLKTYDFEHIPILPVMDIACISRAITTCQSKKPTTHCVKSRMSS